MKDVYEMSRSDLYLRLLPIRRDTEEGKRHIKTVPVKIRRVKIISEKSMLMPTSHLQLKSI